MPYTETNANIPQPTAGDQVKSTVHIVRPFVCRSSEDSVHRTVQTIIETASPVAVVSVCVQLGPRETNYVSPGAFCHVLLVL